MDSGLWLLVRIYDKTMAKKTEERKGINSQVRRFRLTGLTPLLGTVSADPELYASYIGTKVPDNDEDSVKLPTYADEEKKGLTVFPVDDADVPVILAHQLKGFLKEALNILRPQNNIGNPRQKGDNYLFVEPEQIYLYRDGKMIEEVDGRKERPLRKERMGQIEVSLVSSERIDTPWEIVFDLELIDNKNPRSKAQTRPVEWDDVYKALDYGRRKGLLQWRNAGWGRFTWEEITDAE